MMFLAYFSITNVYFLQNMVYVVVSYSSFLPKNPSVRRRSSKSGRKFAAWTLKMEPRNGLESKHKKDIEKNGI